jgi:hypothetical protein
MEHASFLRWSSARERSRRSLRGGGGGGRGGGGGGWWWWWCGGGGRAGGSSTGGGWRAGRCGAGWAGAGPRRRQGRATPVRCCAAAGQGRAAPAPAGAGRAAPAGQVHQRQAALQARLAGRVRAADVEHEDDVGARGLRVHGSGLARARRAGALDQLRRDVRAGDRHPAGERGGGAGGLGRGRCAAPGSSCTSAVRSWRVGVGAAAAGRAAAPRRTCWRPPRACGRRWGRA